MAVTTGLKAPAVSTLISAAATGIALSASPVTLIIAPIATRHRFKLPYLSPVLATDCHPASRSASVNQSGGVGQMPYSFLP